MIRYLSSTSMAAVLVLVAGTRVVAQSSAPDGQAVFRTTCSLCHTGAADSRAPSPESLRARSPESIVSALTGGTMRYQGLKLSGAERRAVAEYLTGKKFGTTDVTGAGMGRCTTSPAFADPSKSPSWSGWSPSVTNTHFQPAAQAGLTAEQTPQLKLKWALGFPDAELAWAQPMVASGRVFVGSQNGTVYSLDAKSGCIYWVFSADGGVRASISIGPRTGGGYTAYFSDQRGNVYALDAATGKLVWKRRVEDHPLVRLTGSPTLYAGRLYVPAASLEESQGGIPSYECCTFRGSLAALDAQTGAVVWKTYTIVDEPKPRKKNSVGTTLWGPSGAGVWSAPVIDVKRGAVYVSTGNAYSEPAAPTTDSILALDLKTGKIRWVFQATAKDTAIDFCGPTGVNPMGTANTNCPEEPGPDADFASPPVLVTLPNGKDLVIAGQKAVALWALDPDKRGQVVWKHPISVDGRGGGGVKWGTAADAVNAYFPMNNSRQAGETSAGGVYAVNLATGERAWFTPSPPLPTCGSGVGCNGGVSNSLTVIPGAVFAGGNDGAVRAYSTKDGSIVWQFDTNREFKTVNGVAAKGASIIGPGPIVVGGMVFVDSGYGAVGGRPGNALLAFGIE
jgi:polyvinyl alcohol dehydrogenase (cytochrome)